MTVEERILEQVEKAKHLKPFADYIITELAANEKLTENLMKRDLKNAYEYCKKEAQKVAVSGVAMIEDKEVYGWIREFYEISDLEVAKVIKPPVKRANPVEVIRKVEPVKKPEPKRVDKQQSLFDLLGGGI